MYFHQSAISAIFVVEIGIIAWYNDNGTVFHTDGKSARCTFTRAGGFEN
jgi:hypothetical protein